jgi:hypothetical protein
LLCPLLCCRMTTLDPHIRLAGHHTCGLN